MNSIANKQPKRKPIILRFQFSIFNFPFSIIITLCLIAALSINAFAARVGFGNFRNSGEYTAGQFHDIGGTEWFALYVEDAYNFGFFKGRSENMFDHGGLLTLGEAVTITARLRCIYYTGRANFDETVPYYSAYADYALIYGIITSHGNYNAPVTRSQFAQLVYNALPEEALVAINEVPALGICDVVPGSDYADAIYALYRAGILAGSDRHGTFFPGSNITRAEACAIMVRLANPSARLNTRLPAQLPAEVIYQRSSSAVFMLEMFNERGRSIRTGSGFFISDTGYAATNLHVIENAVSAKITLDNGDVYPVRGVHAISEEYNLVIFSIDSDAGGWSFLNLADSDLIATGNTIYTLGSPRGLFNTFSDGIVSNASREVDESIFIQFTAPISFGSGGSPVLNGLGHVVGIASSTYTHGQNLNLAVPVNHLKTLEPGELTTLEELLSS